MITIPEKRLKIVKITNIPTSSDPTIMSFVSLPLFEGFNTIAIWPSQHPVSDCINSFLLLQILLLSNVSWILKVSQIQFSIESILLLITCLLRCPLIMDYCLQVQLQILCQLARWLTFLFILLVCLLPILEGARKK